MNLVEAKRNFLIIEPRSDMKVPLKCRRWHLIVDIRTQNPVLSQEKFTTEEVQGLINLLEKVRTETQ